MFPFLSLLGYTFILPLESTTQQQLVGTSLNDDSAWLQTVNELEYKNCEKMVGENFESFPALEQ